MTEKTICRHCYGKLEQRYSWSGVCGPPHCPNCKRSQLISPNMWAILQDYEKTLELYSKILDKQGKDK